MMPRCGTSQLLDDDSMNWAGSGVWTGRKEGQQDDLQDQHLSRRVCRSVDRSRQRRLTARHRAPDAAAPEPPLARPTNQRVQRSADVPSGSRLRSSMPLAVATSRLTIKVKPSAERMRTHSLGGGACEPAGRDKAGSAGAPWLDSDMRLRRTASSDILECAQERAARSTKQGKRDRDGVEEERPSESSPAAC